MQRTAYYAVAVLVGTACLLGACASGVSLPDAYRPGFGYNAPPPVDYVADYAGAPNAYAAGAQQPCLMSSPRCTPDRQLQWAEANQR